MEHFKFVRSKIEGSIINVFLLEIRKQSFGLNRSIKTSLDFSTLLYLFWVDCENIMAFAEISVIRHRRSYNRLNI